MAAVLIFLFDRFIISRAAQKKHVIIRLLVLIVAHIIVAHDVIVVVGPVMEDITHLLSSVILAVVNGSGDRGGR
jgi:hypothetical protein